MDTEQLNYVVMALTAYIILRDIIKGMAKEKVDSDAPILKLQEEFNQFKIDKKFDDQAEVHKQVLRDQAIDSTLHHIETENALILKSLTKALHKKSAPHHKPNSTESSTDDA